MNSKGIKKIEIFADDKSLCTNNYIPLIKGNKYLKYSR